MGEHPVHAADLRTHGLDGMHASGLGCSLSLAHFSFRSTQPSPRAARRMLPGEQAGILAIMQAWAADLPGLQLVDTTVLLGCRAPSPNLLHLSSTPCIAAHLPQSARATSVSLPLPAALRPRIGALLAASATAALPAVYWDGCLPALLAQHTRLLSACSPPRPAFTSILFFQIASSKWAPKSSVIR